MSDRRMDRLMIVTLDITDPRLEIEEVRKLITSDENISNWWNHIPGVYLVTTNCDAEELSERIRPLLNETSFLAMEVNPAESEGLLPKRAWRWIRRRSRERERAAAA